jgi:hypothetical protein
MERGKAKRTQQCTPSSLEETDAHFAIQHLGRPACMDLRASCTIILPSNNAGARVIVPLGVGPSGYIPGTPFRVALQCEKAEFVFACLRSLLTIVTGSCLSSGTGYWKGADAGAPAREPMDIW